MQRAALAEDHGPPPELIGRKGPAQSLWEAGPADTLTSDSGLPSCDTVNVSFQVPWFVALCYSRARGNQYADLCPLEGVLLPAGLTP